MYQGILDRLEPEFKVAWNMNEDINKLHKLADLIIKIKTIQAMDMSAELIRDSRKVMKKPTFRKNKNWDDKELEARLNNILPNVKYSGL